MMKKWTCGVARIWKCPSGKITTLRAFLFLFLFLLF